MKKKQQNVNEETKTLFEVQEIFLSYLFICIATTLEKNVLKTFRGGLHLYLKRSILLKFYLNCLNVILKFLMIFLKVFCLIKYVQRNNVQMH